MTQKQFEVLLMVITPQVIQYIMQNKNLPLDKAATIFYNSQLYKTLEIEESKVWHFSSLLLYELLDEELTTGTIDWPEEQ
jgi:hypothetical protein